jgi:hypothetical protein
LKAHYRKKAIARSITVFTDNNQTNVTQIFNVNQLVAMKMAQKAWDNVSQATISNCWAATRIIKNQSSDGCLENIEKTLEQTNDFIEKQLDTLQHIGAVLPTNRMSITNLLYPEGENTEAARVWSNEEIFDLVEEEDKQEDADSDEDDVAEPKVTYPSKKETIKHLSQVLLYLEHINQPQNNNMVALLEGFQQDLLKEIHFGGTQSEIKDYFQPITEPASSRTKSPDSQDLSSTSQNLPNKCDLLKP